MLRPPQQLAAMAAPHLPRSPVLVCLIVFLGVHHAPAAHGNPALLPLTYDTSMCARDSFLCGSVEIHYPFYLSNATRETPDHRPYACGFTDLNISCQLYEQTWTATILLGGDSYTVKNILYNTGTIILADTDVLRGGATGDCPRVRHNVTFDEAWLHNTSSYDLSFFYGCFSDGNAPPVFEKYQIHCGGFNNSRAGGGYSFMFTPDELEKPLQDELVAGHCNQTVDVPVRSEFVVDPSKLRSSGYGSVLQQGFELAWRRKTTDMCYRCEQSSGGKCAYRYDRSFLGCLCIDGTVETVECKNSGASTANPPPPAPKGRNTNTPIIAGVVAGGGVVALLAAAAAFFIMRKRKQKKVINSSSKLLKYSGSGGTPHSGGGDMESGSIQDLKTHIFSYEELEEATDGFNENRELGDGGFGTVYKGYLQDGRVVAVKRLYNNSYRRVEQFVNEAEILSRLRHPNLVMFYGCTSSQSRELLLVYEFVANGTVADHLHGHRAPERALSWPLRLGIAVESAAALHYLHAIEPPIVHRDVKTTNILLDADFHVKVADFGLSRLFPLDATHVSTAPQGTPGYVDPEYHQCYQLTDKSDVYSFGVVLVELISSKPAVDITRHRNEINLAGMAINKIQKCQLEELVDLDLGYEADPATKKMMTMVAELAFRCLQQNGEMRPPIKEVLEVLRSIQAECLPEKDGDKHKDGPFSPNTVHAPWDSRSTTPNTSRD